MGDCDGDGQVRIDELVTILNIALDIAAVSACEAGDTDGDGRITIEEVVAAVNDALTGCMAPSPEQGCLDSGGTVATALCCASSGDFPDTCAIGACGCPPAGSREVRVCDCPAGSCFDGGECVER